MKHSITILAVCVLVLSIMATAQVPQKISYQGLLTTSAGAPVQDGSYNLRFDIYNLPSAGTLRYTQTLNGVSVARGTFSVILGPLSEIFSESLYVQVTALAGSPGISSDITFSPRSELTSAPYALAPWTPTGNNVYFSGDNVGIGTTSFVSGERLAISDENQTTRLGIFPGYRDNVYYGWDWVTLDIPFEGYLRVWDNLSVSGKVCIGTYYPTRKLWVNGDAGGTTGWFNDSDRRLKKNVETITDALSKVEKLRGVEFEWKDTSNHPSGKHIGLIAQEMQSVLPEVVSRAGEYYSIEYATIVSLLIEAVKEQQKEIDHLKEIVKPLAPVGAK